MTKFQWWDLSREEQSKYYDMALQIRQKHMEMYPYPLWNARDNYRFGLKKKKSKRNDSDDNNLKKCRVRYGLDQQDAWCRPCK